MATKIWNYYARAAGLQGPWIQVKQTVLMWWQASGNAKIKTIFQVVPLTVLWFIWKWRNIVQHGEYKPILEVKIVRWCPPPCNWFKCNTDGDSRGNPRPSSVAFCVRNKDGDVVGAKGFRLQDTTNIVVEAIAIMEELKYCIESDFLPLIVETDSLTMIHILDGN
ncbi:hypothetical protein KY289_013632 [Solanum tuberosum]|nr:hypothetical protein KY289_013632 [Solanum tuberosum]